MPAFVDFGVWFAGLRENDWGVAFYFFGLFTLIYLPLELCFPAQRQRVFRREWSTDLLFYLGQFLLWTAPVVAVLVSLKGWFDSWTLLQTPRLAFASLPAWLQIGGLVLISDICIYWGHRWSHQNPFLWRFHRVHHTAERLDWLAAYREHPFDNLYTRTIENLPLLILGVPLHWFAGFFLFRGFWALYIHSNIALSPGPLRYLLGSSRLHHWHHDLGTGGRYNYANLSPLMDLMFGTFYDPRRMPEEYGIEDEVHHNYFRQLLDPLLPGTVHQEPGDAQGVAAAAGVSAAGDAELEDVISGCEPGGQDVGPGQV